MFRAIVKELPYNIYEHRNDTTSLPKGKFDVIVCSDVIESSVRWRNDVNKLLVRMTKGGSLIVVTPNIVLWRIARLLSFRSYDKNHLNNITPVILTKNVIMMKPLTVERVLKLPFSWLPLTYVTVFKA